MRTIHRPIVWWRYVERLAIAAVGALLVLPGPASGALTANVALAANPLPVATISYPMLGSGLQQVNSGPRDSITAQNETSIALWRDNAVVGFNDFDFSSGQGSGYAYRPAGSSVGTPPVSMVHVAMSPLNLLGITRWTALTMPNPAPQSSNNPEYMPWLTADVQGVHLNYYMRMATDGIAVVAQTWRGRWSLPRQLSQQFPPDLTAGPSQDPEIGAGCYMGDYLGSATSGGQSPVRVSAWGQNQGTSSVGAVPGGYQPDVFSTRY